MKTKTATVGAFEAKNTFSELLEKVARGAEITITKHDRPVARLVPVKADVDLEARRKAVDEWKKLRVGLSLKGLSIREMINEGRR